MHMYMYMCMYMDIYVQVRATGKGRGADWLRARPARVLGVSKLLCSYHNQVLSAPKNDSDMMSVSDHGP